MDVYDTIVKNLNRLRKRGRDVSAIECTCTDLYKKLGYTEQTLKKFFHEELSVENIMLETANDIYGSDEKLINNEMYFKENLSFIEEMQFLQMLYDEKKLCSFPQWRYLSMPYVCTFKRKISNGEYFR